MDGSEITITETFDYTDAVKRFVDRFNRHVDEQAVEQVEGRLAELGYRKCSECTERQGYYLDAETIQRQRERIAELEGKLAHAHAAHPYDCVLTFTDSEYDEMQRERREKDATIAALSRAADERDELIRDQQESIDVLQAEVERYREQCGKLLDAAHEMQRIGTLVDANGEVVG